MLRLRPVSRTRQYGYQYEYPLIFVASVMLLSVVFPMLPPLAGKLLVSVLALPILGSLFYMIVTPGWQPGARRLGLIWRVLGFGCATLFVLALVVAVWLKHTAV